MTSAKPKSRKVAWVVLGMVASLVASLFFWGSDVLLLPILYAPWALMLGALVLVVRELMRRRWQSR